jgi:hypothetical protein
MKTFNVYVNTGGPIIHLHANALVEGAAMLCGRRVRPGWLWFSRSSGRKRPTDICKQCAKAAKR